MLQIYEKLEAWILGLLDEFACLVANCLKVKSQVLHIAIINQFETFMSQWDDIALQSHNNYLVLVL